MKAYQVINEGGYDAGNESRLAIFINKSDACKYVWYLHTEIELTNEQFTIQEIAIVKKHKRKK